MPSFLPIVASSTTHPGAQAPRQLLHRVRRRRRRPPPAPSAVSPRRVDIDDRRRYRRDTRRRPPKAVAKRAEGRMPSGWRGRAGGGVGPSRGDPRGRGEGRVGGFPRVRGRASGPGGCRSGPPDPARPCRRRQKPGGVFRGLPSLLQALGPDRSPARARGAFRRRFRRRLARLPRDAAPRGIAAVAPGLLPGVRQEPAGQRPPSVLACAPRVSNLGPPISRATPPIGVWAGCGQRLAEQAIRMETPRATSRIGSSVQAFEPRSPGAPREVLDGPGVRVAP